MKGVCVGWRGLTRVVRRESEWRERGKRRENLGQRRTRDQQVKGRFKPSWQRSLFCNKQSRTPPPCLLSRSGGLRLASLSDTCSETTLRGKQVQRSKRGSSCYSSSSHRFSYSFPSQLVAFSTRPVVPLLLRPLNLSCLPTNHLVSLELHIATHVATSTRQNTATSSHALPAFVIHLSGSKNASVRPSFSTLVSLHSTPQGQQKMNSNTLILVRRVARELPFSLLRLSLPLSSVFTLGGAWRGCATKG